MVYIYHNVLCFCMHDRVHVGDMANLVTSYAIDGERIVTAAVTLEEHSLIGAAAVAMPGSTLGKGATLGAAAATLPGTQLPGAHLIPFYCMLPGGN